jgi:putative transposase
VECLWHSTNSREWGADLSMPDYRRNRVPGGTYFFTVNLVDRRFPLLVEHIDDLRQSVRRVRELMPFHIDAWVVLPEHMHALWTLPEGDADYPKRWQAIKMAFSRRVVTGEMLSVSRQRRGQRGIWQRRSREHTIGNDRDSATHMDYIHFNPVKHGLVGRNGLAVLVVLPNGGGRDISVGMEDQ